MGQTFRFSAILIALGLGAALLGACQPIPEKNTSQDPIENANRLIDQGNYDAAIAELESLSQVNPHPKIREILASAYAARAGLLVERHWGFLMGFEAPRNPAQRNFGDSRSSRSLESLYKLAVDIEMWSARIESLPVVVGPARADIEKAILILSDQPIRGARLYRALLGFVLVKADIIQAQDAWDRAEVYFREVDIKNLSSPKNLLILCRKDVQVFAGHVGIITLHLQTIVEDLIVSFPSKQGDLIQALTRTRELSQPLLAVGQGQCKI